MALYHSSELMGELMQKYSDVLDQRLVEPPSPKKAVDPYFGANVPLSPLRKAVALRGSALATMLALAHQRKLSGCGNQVRLCRRVAQHMDLTDQQLLRGAKKLEEGGLLRFVTRGAGRRGTVVLMF